MAERIKVLIVPSDGHGVGYWRSILPARAIEKYHSDEFDVTIDMSPNWSDVDGLKKYDIIHFHKGVVDDQEGFWNSLTQLKDVGVKILMDVDDAYWHLDRTHPQYHANKNLKIPERVRKTMAMVDCVTCTTPIFEAEIKKYNKNTFVMPNGPDPDDPQFIPHKEPSPRGRIRFGFVMGSSHEPDLEIMRGTFAKLPNDIIPGIEFHLCGYDTRGATTVYYPDGHYETRPIKPEETCWKRFEELITDNYNPRFVSPQYKQFLDLHIPNGVYPGVDDERYVRQWTRDVNHYCTHYNTVDVLLVPLRASEFNKHKSQLKLIEAAFLDTAVICSDFGPYTVDTINLFEKGGEINPKGNAILIDEAKNHKAWAKAIEKIARNPELIEILRENLKETMIPKYSQENLSKERCDYYKQILGR